MFFEDIGIVAFCIWVGGIVYANLTKRLAEQILIEEEKYNLTKLRKLLRRDAVLYGIICVDLIIGWYFFATKSDFGSLREAVVIPIGLATVLTLILITTTIIEWKDVQRKKHIFVDLDYLSKIRKSYIITTLSSLPLICVIWWFSIALTRALLLLR